MEALCAEGVEELDDLRDQRHVGAGEDRDPDQVRVGDQVTITDGPARSGIS